MANPALSPTPAASAFRSIARLAVWIAATCFLAGCPGGGDPAPAAAGSGDGGGGGSSQPAHPRLLLTPTLLTDLQARASGNTAEWQRLKKACDDIGTTKSSGYYGAYWAEAVANLSMCFLATNNAAYATKAIVYADALANDRSAVGDGLGGDLRVNDGNNGYSIRFHGVYLALAYDWLHTYLAANAPAKLATYKARLNRWIVEYEPPHDGSPASEAGYLNNVAKHGGISNYYMAYFLTKAFTGFATYESAADTVAAAHIEGTDAQLPPARPISLRHGGLSEPRLEDRASRLPADGDLVGGIDAAAGTRLQGHAGRPTSPALRQQPGRRRLSLGGLPVQGPGGQSGGLCEQRTAVLSCLRFGSRLHAFRMDSKDGQTRPGQGMCLTCAQGVTIPAFADDGRSLFVQADMTSAYHGPFLNTVTSNPATSVIRNLVFVRPGYVLIHDAVRLKKDIYQPITTLHTLNAPTISGDLLSATSGGSKVFARSLLPVGANFVAVAETNSWNDQDGNRNSYGTNVAGRVEVTSAPAAGKLDHAFLQVIAAADIAAATPTIVRLSSGDGNASANVAGAFVDNGTDSAVVLFSTAPASAPVAGSIAYTLPGIARQHVLTNLPPGAKYRAVLPAALPAAQSYQILPDPNGSLTASAQGVLTLAFP